MTPDLQAIEARCPECNAPEGTCWSQSGSMGQRPSCHRDPTVGYSREDWLAHVRALQEENARLKEQLSTNTEITGTLRDADGAIVSISVWDHMTNEQGLRFVPATRLATAQEENERLTGEWANAEYCRASADMEIEDLKAQLATVTAERDASNAELKKQLKLLRILDDPRRSSGDCCATQYSMVRGMAKSIADVLAAASQGKEGGK